MPDSLAEYLSSFPEWNDDQIALSLFAAFHGSREDMEESWSRKILFWKGVIYHSTGQKWLGNSSLFCFNGQHLGSHFGRKGVFPLGMDFVIQNLVEAREIVLYKSLGLGSFLQDPLGKLIALFQAGFRMRTHDHCYLVIPLVERAVEKLAMYIKSQSNDFVDACLTREKLLDGFKRVCNGLELQVPTDRDLDIALEYWRFKAKLVSTVDGATHVLYLDQNWIMDSKTRRAMVLNGEFTNETVRNSRSIVHLKQVLNSLQEQISRIHTQALGLGKSVQSFMALQNKQAALDQLRRVKSMEKTRQDLMASKSNIEHILETIRTAGTDAQILEAYKLGAKTLNQMTVSKDKVEQIMDSVHESLDTVTSEAPGWLDLGSGQPALLDSTDKDVETLLEQVSTLRVVDMPLPLQEDSSTQM